MSAAKDKGTRFEREVADYMAARLGADVDRDVLRGSADTGDIRGFTLRGKACVVECKNHRRAELSAWVDEAERERGNADAEFAFVVHKRKGRGKANMGDTYVTCTLDNLLAVAAGSRALLEGEG